MTRGQIIQLSIAGALLLAATALVAKVGLEREKNHVIVDAGDVAARVEIDGAVVGTVAAGSHKSFEVKKGKHVVRAVHPDGSAEETKLDVPKTFYRGLFRLHGARPVALVSVAYGHCKTYYNSGHRVVWQGKAIEEPGMIVLPTEPRLIELPKAIYVDSFDQRFPKTFPGKRGECGYLSTHLCHVGPDGEPACEGVLDEHESKTDS